MSHANRPCRTPPRGGRTGVAAATPALLLAGLLAVTACDGSPAGLERLGPDEGTVEIRTSVQTPTVSTLVVEVSASDIPDPQLFNLELVGSDTDGDGVDDRFTASDVLRVSAGGGRLFDVRAFDDAGIRTHEGSATMDVVPGPNATAVAVTLDPLTGNQPIEIVLGSFDVTVTPETATMAAGETRQFTAEVTDRDGAVDGASVRWATSNPGVASVDATGLATGRAEGAARIVATWMGVGGQADLTVMAATASRSRIAYVSDRTGRDQLFVVDLDEGVHRQIQGDVFFQRDPAWSPDGRHLAFYRGTDNHDIWVSELDEAGFVVSGSGVQVTLDVATDRRPAWRPDGGQIAFHSSRTDASSTQDEEIWVVVVDGSGARAGSPVQVTDHPAVDRQASWSPDGSHIAFTSNRSGNPEIWVVEVDAAGSPVGSPVQVTQHAAIDEFPTWSLDGGRIAFTSGRSGGGDIWVVEVTTSGSPTSTPVRVTSHAAHDREPAWSPDGGSLAFQSLRGDGTGTVDAEIWIVEVGAAGVPSGVPVQVTSSGAHDRSPAWTAY